MSDLPCACGLTMADNCRCEAGDIAYTADLQAKVAKLRGDLSDATTECALWLDRASRHRAEIERLQAELREARELLEKMQRSRDRYREEWERARGREEAAATSALAKSQ